ncbi:MAG: hypothetical protein MJZ29_08635 [Bacteroidaceae bacterium]|nr:hypothetical protein [Bacteroidaceae bacterium]
MKKHFYSFLAMLTAMFALSSCEDVPMPYDLPIFGGGGDSTTIEPKGSGTASDPFNVAAAIEKCKEVGTTVSADVYYIQGVVKNVDTSGAAQYGNISIDMIDEGGSDVFKAFQILGIDGKKFTEATASEIKEGDVVVVKGKVYNYSGNTPETEGKGAAQLVSVNGVGGNDTPVIQGEPKGTGTQADPYNATAAIAYATSLAADTESANDIYVKGIVVEVKEAFSDYGNATFYIADSNESADKFYCFRALGLGNKQCKDPNALMVGDEVIVCGKVVNYKGNTPETVQNKAYIYSLNGKVEGGGTTPEVTPGTPSGNGTIDTPFNVAAAVQKCKETGETATAEQYYVQGIIETINTSGVDQYGNISINMVDVAGSSEVFQAYQINSLNGEKFTSATAGTLKKGDVIVIKGNLVNYKGNTPETTGKGAGCLVFVNGKTELGTTTGGGNDNPGGNTGDANINVDETFDVASFVGVVESGKEINGTSVGGLSFTADKGTNTNAPKFYSSNGFNTIRMYPTNTVTITFSKNVKNIAINCDTYQNIVCVAEGKGEASPGNATTIGDVIVVKDINSNTVTIKNGHTGTGTAAQIRIKTIGIEYVKANAKANSSRRK